MKKYILRIFCHDVLVKQIGIEAENRTDALNQYIASQSVEYGPEDMGWPRRGDTLCVDVVEEETQNQK